MVPVGAFRWLAGEGKLVNHKMPEAKVKGTAFCQVCGSQMPRLRGADHMQIPTGCLDDDPGGRPSVNIFTGSKASWSVVDERLPGFRDAPPG